MSFAEILDLAGIFVFAVSGALPAMIGAAVEAVTYALGAHNEAITFSAAASTFVLRMLAMRFGWRAPRPRGVTD